MSAVRISDDVLRLPRCATIDHRYHLDLPRQASQRAAMAAMTPARKVVEAFGDCDALASMYTDDVVWRLNHSLAPNIKGARCTSSVCCPACTAPTVRKPPQPLTARPPLPGPHDGKEAVCGFNVAVFTKFYQEGTTTVEILDEIGTEASSVVRFNMRATSRAGHSYDVEYVLFAKTRDGLVYEVVELMDSQASAEQHQGNAVGVAPRL